MKQSKQQSIANPGGEQYRPLFQFHPQPMWVYDIETLNFLAVNNAAIARYGYSEEEFLRMTIKEIRPSEDVPKLLRKIANLTDGYTNPGIWRHLKKDGTLMHVEISSHTLIFNDRRAELVMAHDVTERIASEETRQEAELRFRQIAENIQHVFWMTDPDKNEMLYVSPAYEQIWQRRTEDLYRSPRSWMDAIDPADRDSAVHAALTKQRDGSYDQKYRIHRPDGSVRWIRDRAFPVKNEQGEVYRVTGIAADITDFVTAEKALKESEARFRTLAQTASAAIFIYQEKFKYVNPAAEALTGYSSDELLRMNFWDVVHQEHRELVRERGLSRLRGEPVGDRYEFKILRKDGKVRWIDFSAGIFKPNGSTSAIGTAFDITERKQFEEQIRNSERLYRDLVENSNEVTYLLDRNLVLTYISPVMETRTGFSSAELLGRRFVDLIHPDDVAGVKRSFREEIIGGTTDPVEFRFVAKSGNTIWARASAVPVMKEGKLESIRGVAIDITERKLTEDALRASEERFRTLTETASSAIFIYQGEYLRYANRSAEQLLGYSREELLSKKFWEVIHPDEQEIVRRGGIARQRGDDVPSNIEVRWVTKTGEIRWVDFTAAMIQHEGKPAVLGTAFDITGRKKAEEALSEKEYLLSTAQRIARMGSWSFDFATNKTTWSNETYRLYGVSPETFVPSAESLSELIHPEDRPQLVRSIQAYAKGENLGTIEVRVPLPDGTIRTLEGQGELGFDEQGRPVRIIGTLRDITEQKQAEEALRESEDRFRRLAENAQDIIYRYEFAPRRGFTYVSPAATHITGYTPEDHYADPDLGFKLVHPDDIHMFQNATKPGQGSGEPLTLRWIKRDGTVIWTEQKNIQFFDNDGNLIAIEGIARDVTERKKAEYRLHQSEAKYRDVVENASDVIYLTDINGKFTYANPAGLKVSGYSLDELKGLGYLDLVEPRYRKQVSLLYMRQFLAMKPSTTVDFPYKTKSGELGWFSQVASLILVDGKPSGFRIIARDITDRKRAEEQLHDSEERYRQFFENDLTGDYISTPDGRLIECNPAFLKIFGFTSREEALQTNVEVLHSHPGARKEFLDRLQKEKFLVYEEGTGRRIDGTPIYVVENVAGVFNEQGGLAEIRGYLFDDTKRKQFEQQFYQAQKMESIGTLAGGIAHDFNNILGIILGHASLLNRGAMDEAKLSQSIEAIQTATKRGASLVRQLLTFARKTEPEFQSVRINDVIREITGLITETFPKTINVSNGLQTDLPSISGDPTQIHQVVLNLCVNARDAMPDGGTLELSTSLVAGSSVAHVFPQAGEFEYIAVAVTDSGMGMDEATRLRIFEPFFTTKDVGKGTGLGLSLVHSIVSNHNGFVDVRSAKGMGTTFRLYFPTERQLSRSREESEQPVAKIKGGNETVLVIEDEEMLRELLKAALTSKGYTVMTAGDGREGVALLERHRDTIALVISDMGLPQLQGSTVLKRARSLNPNVGLILASGYLEPRVKSDLEKNGCRHFLQKPYVAEEVLRVVRKVIDGGFM